MPRRAAYAMPLRPRDAADADQRDLASCLAVEASQNACRAFEKRCAGQAACLFRMGRADALARQRGVGCDDRVNRAARATAAMSASAASSRSGAILMKTGGRVASASRASMTLFEQRAKGFCSLQVAQLFRVRRRDVDGQEVCSMPGNAHDLREIGTAVGAVLVRADVQTDRNALWIGAGACGKARGDHLGAFVVEAETVDDRAVFAQAEQARFRIAGLRARVAAPTSIKPKPHASVPGRARAFLSETGGEADGIGQGPARRRGSQPRRGNRLARQGHEPARKGDQRHIMRPLGAEGDAARKARGVQSGSCQISGDVSVGAKGQGRGSCLCAARGKDAGKLPAARRLPSEIRQLRAVQRQQGAAGFAGEMA